MSTAHKSYARRQLLRLAGASAASLALLAACETTTSQTSTSTSAPTTARTAAGTVAQTTSTSTPTGREAATSSVATASSSAAAPTASSGAQNKAGVTVSLLAIMNPELQAWYQEHVFTPYMQQHPDIKVDLIIYLYADRYTKPEVMMAADTPPDVTAWYQHAFVDKGMFTELTPLAAASKLDPKSFYDLSIEYVTVDNKLWGIPYRVNDYVIYYNKDIFHAAGVELPPLKWDDTSWTWTKFLDIAHRLTQQEGSVTKAFGLGGLAGNNQYPWYYGEHWLTPDRTKVALDPNGPGIALLQQAVNQFLPSVHSGPVGKEAGGDDVFAQGRAAMKEAGTWDLQNFKPKLAFNWGLAPLPRGNRSANTYFADGYSIFKGAKHLDQGWTFIQYLVSPAMQKGINERYGAFPSLTSLEQWSATQQTTFPEAYRAVPVEGLPYGVNPSFEKIKESAAVQSAVDKAFGPVALGQQSAKAAFEAIIPQINAILAGSQ